MPARRVVRPVSPNDSDHSWLATIDFKKKIFRVADHKTPNLQGILGFTDQKNIILKTISGDFGDPIDWVEKMALAIDDRLMQEGLRPNSLGNRANIVCYTWEEAFTKNPIKVSSVVDIHGYHLANKLNTLLGQHYDNKNIQFIQSLGVRFPEACFAWNCSEVLGF